MKGCLTQSVLSKLTIQEISHNNRIMAWLPILLEDHVGGNCGIAYNCKMSRYILALTVGSAKKNGHMILFFNNAYHTFEFWGVSLYSTTVWGCFVPHMQQLCLLTFLEVWNVASSEKQIISRNASFSSILARISKNVFHRGLSSGLI